MPALPERLKEEIEILDGEYVVLPEYKSAGALIAEVCHVHRNGVGGKVVTPVGRLSAFIYSGEEAEDLFNPHWSIHLFIRSDVRYQAHLHRTDVVTNPEEQAGPKSALLHHLPALRDSNFPLVHPELPHALAVALIKAGLCPEPASVHVHVAQEHVLAEDSD